MNLGNRKRWFLERRENVCDNINIQCPPNCVGVEIGVMHGEMSRCILSDCAVSHLYLIDPYIGNYTSRQERTDDNQKNMDRRHQKTRDYFLREHKDRTTFIRKKSEDATHDVPNELDFIYIDGNHAYEYVKKDLQLWTPKIKKGGLVMGDDWCKLFSQVIRAICDFAEKEDPFLPPFGSYSEKYTRVQVPAPGTGKALVNKNGQTWWGIKK